MSLTVNSRPATWAGTSGPIIYKMTTTDHANAGYYLLVEIWNSTTGLKIGSQKCYPNSGGLLSVRVESILRSNMSLDNNSDLTTGDTVYLDGNWIKYYIKYNQYWTGSSPALIDDVANLRYAIYGGLQIGSANDFSAYTSSANQKFLTVSTILTGIINNFLTLSFASLTTNELLFVYRFLGSTRLGILSYPITDIGVYRAKLKEIGTADKLQILKSALGSQILANPEFLITLPWTSIGPGSESTWALSGTKMATTMSGGFFSTQDLNQTIAISSGDYTCEIDITIGGFSGVLSDPTVKIFVNEAGIPREVFSQDLSFSTASVNHVIKFILSVPVSATDIYLAVTRNSNAATNLIELDYFRVRESTLSEQKEVTILPNISNIIVLQWKNSLGGDECFPFTYNQEYFYTNSDGKKSKRMILYANGLTPLQWDAIQGCKSVGDVYRTPINELTTSLNRTVGRIGQSVYVLNSDGTKTGVIVIPNSDSSFTKKTIHETTVEIEFPELFLQ